MKPLPVALVASNLRKEAFAVLFLISFTRKRARVELTLTARGAVDPIVDRSLLSSIKQVNDRRLGGQEHRS